MHFKRGPAGVGGKFLVEGADVPAPNPGMTSLFGKGHSIAGHQDFGTGNEPKDGASFVFALNFFLGDNLLEVLDLAEGLGGYVRVDKD